MPRHKLFIVLGAFLLLACAFISDTEWFLPLAHAGPPVIPSGTEAEIAKVIGYAILGLNLLAWVLFTFLNFLLDPEFIFGTDGNLLEILNQLWQLSRDLMNVIFALVLVGAAIYTIVTAKKEFLSQYGPKFIAAVVLVNFSWFLPRLVIDIANVGASAVYGIPSLMATNPNAQCRVMQQHAPMAVPNGCTAVGGNAELSTCPCKGVTDALFFLESEQEAGFYQATGYTCPLGLVFCYKESVLDFAAVAPHSAVLNGLVLNHARLGALASVPIRPAGAAAGSETNRMIMFLMRELMVLLIHAAIVFPLLAMTIAFFIRIPVLWITMAFMPFYFLDVVLGGPLEQFTQGALKKILSTFIKAAFLPMLIAVPFSIGLLMLNAASHITGGTMAAIPFRIFDGINNFWQLLWLCMSLGVLWVGVFSILKGDDILSSGAQSIKGFGQSLGSIALKAPLAIPTIPGSGGNMSFLGLAQRAHPRAISAALSSGTPLKGITDQLMGRGPNPAAKAAKELLDPTNRDRLEELRKLTATAHNSNAALTRITEILGQRGLSTDHNNIRINIENLQKAGVGLGTNGGNLSGDQIRQIEQFAIKEAEGKKKQEDLKKQEKKKGE